MNSIFRRITPSASTAIALIALIVAMSGSAVAASLITSKQIKDGTIQVRDISKSARAKLKGTLGPAGPAGAQGAQGEKGDTGGPGANGANATNLWAKVRADGTLTSGKGVTSASRLAQGNYEVIFDRDVTGCSYSVSPNGIGTNPGKSVFIWATGRGTAPNGVFVLSNTTVGTENGLTDTSFHVQVFC